nr:gamma-glutamyltransferase [Thermoleophilaceae bacterium]
GILIAYALDLLERLGDQGERYMKAIVQAMDAANRARTGDFVEGLKAEGYMETFLAAESLAAKAHAVSSRLGSTTHLSALDEEGNCASVTCSNGSGSAVIVPGTGVHLNNMLGEEDLNPGGFHLHEPGERVTSMMAPTVVLKDGECQVALGSAGSNRIRSAVLQTALNVIDGELDAQPAVDRPRIHVEGGTVDAEPGIEDWLLGELEADGWRVQRWRQRDLYFGGVQAVTRDGATGGLTGGGDPRRGGASVRVD